MQNEKESYSENEEYIDENEEIEPVNNCVTAYEIADNVFNFIEHPKSQNENDLAEFEKFSGSIVELFDNLADMDKEMESKLKGLNEFQVNKIVNAFTDSLYIGTLLNCFTNNFGFESLTDLERFMNTYRKKYVVSTYLYLEKTKHKSFELHVSFNIEDIINEKDQYNIGEVICDIPLFGKTKYKISLKNSSLNDIPPLPYNFIRNKDIFDLAKDVYVIKTNIKYRCKNCTEMGFNPRCLNIGIEETNPIYHKRLNNASMSISNGCISISDDILEFLKQIKNMKVNVTALAFSNLLRLQ